MNKTTLITSASVAALLMSSAAMAEPTRGFTQERAGAAESGTVSVDMGWTRELNQTGMPVTFGVRGGLGAGELLINRLDPATGQAGMIQRASIGYKFPFMNDMLAVYGGISFNDWDENADEASAVQDESTTTINFGVAYTQAFGPVSINVNPEIHVADSEDEDGELIRVGAGVFYGIPNTGWSLGLEYNFIDGEFDNAADFDDDSLHLGARWAANDNATLDIVFFEDRGDQDRLSIPGLVQLNVRF